MSSRDLSKKVRSMSDQELYSFFTVERFYQDPELSAAVCQEVENREAARLGRKPAQVVFEDFEDDGGVFGYSSPDGMIALSSLFTEPDPTQTFTPSQLLNTLLHEGRHQWQDMVIDEQLSDVPESVRLLLTVDRYCYISDPLAMIDVGIEPWEEQLSIEYSMQENEIDARFYAIQRMKEIARTTDVDLSFQIELTRSMLSEVYLIEKVQEFCSEEQYRLLEKKRLEKYQARAEMLRLGGEELPELPENFRCYDNIWMIRNIVLPVSEFLKETLNELYAVTNGLKEMVIYHLYEVARIFAMNGKPLEKPEELYKISIENGLTDVLGIKDYKIPAKMEKRIGM